MSKTEAFETFKEISDYDRRQMTAAQPSCFNHIVRFKRYRITIEEVEEPKEVLIERLQKMWDECDNHHHWTPLENAAKSIGYKFPNSAGEKRKRK